jgi:hypothetical protein
MKSPEIRRILETCLVEQGLEVWLIAGRPPLVRFPEYVREMMIGKSLSSQEITDLILERAANARAFWRDHDFYRFDWTCDWRDARFRVFLVRHGDSTMATLTPLPPGTPELQYADDDPGRSAVP